MKTIFLILFFCINLITAQGNNEHSKNKVKELSLDSLITSGKWNVEYIQFGNNTKDFVTNEWMQFLPDGKCEIVVSDIDFRKNWFFNKKNNSIMIKVFTEYTEITNFYEFGIKQKNNTNIILSVLLDNEKVEIGLKKQKL